MEASAKNKKVPAKAEAPAPQDEKRKPLKMFREENVSGSVWTKEVLVGMDRRTFYSITLERSYKIPGQPWKYTRSFDASDLGNLIKVIQQADDFIVSLQQQGAA